MDRKERAEDERLEALRERQLAKRGPDVHEIEGSAWSRWNGGDWARRRRTLPANEAGGGHVRNEGGRG